MEQQGSRIEVFCCYAHEDEPLLNKLKTHLSPLQRQQLIHIWHDRDISAGAEWEQEIEKHLNTAHIILLLISPDFISSEYCYSTELKSALERHNQRKAIVIPVILRPSDWEDVSPGDFRLGQFQALPRDAFPVTRWDDRDDAFLDVAKGIKKVVQDLARFSPRALTPPGQGMNHPYHPTSSLAWSLDGTYLATGHQDATVHIWRTSTGSLYRTYTGHARPIRTLAWSPNGYSLASTDSETFRIWKPSTGLDTNITGDLYFASGVRIEYLTWLADGQLGVFTCNRSSREDIHDASQQVSIVWKGVPSHSDKDLISATFAWSPNGHYLACANTKEAYSESAWPSLSEIQVWDTLTGTGWTADSSRRGPQRPGSAWRPSDPLERLRRRESLRSRINTLAWSPDSQFIASSCCEPTMNEQIICIWSIGNRKLSVLHRSQRGTVTALAWSPDGKYVAFAAWDGTLQICAPDPSTEDVYFGPVRSASPMDILAWSPNGQFIASASREIQIWSVPERFWLKKEES